MPETTAGAPRPLAGDLLPPGPSELLRGLSEGDAGRAAAGFAPGAVYAAVANETDEVAPRAVLEGHEIGAGLAADPRLGCAHQVRVCCVEGDDCLLEGWILDSGGERTRSFAASVQLDGAGTISRCLLFRTPAVEDAGVVGGPNPGGADVRQLLDEYFEELQAARFEAATENYSEDLLYSHPPYSPGAARAEFRGRGELLAGFEARGDLPARIFIDRSIQRGAYLLLEGHSFSDGTPQGPQSSFVSSASLDAGGRIRRYVAFQCKELVPRLGGG
jgi:hypothetical protein